MASFLHTETLKSAGGHGGERGLLVCVHSLLTSGAFLRDFAQKYIEAAATETGHPWDAVLLDSRCHGQSLGLPGLEAPHTVDSMTDDVQRTLLQGIQDGRWGAPKVLLGHSIGGQIMLELTRRLGQLVQDGSHSELAKLGVPQQVWVLDSRALPVPAEAPIRQEVEGLMSLICSVPEPMPSPAAIERVLNDSLAQAGVPEPPTWTAPLCKFLVKDIGRDGYVRQFDCTAIKQMLDSFWGKDFGALIDSPPPGCTLHFVALLESGFWASADGKEELEYIRQAQAGGKAVALHRIEGASHWVPLTHEEELLREMRAAVPELK